MTPAPERSAIRDQALADACRNLDRIMAPLAGLATGLLRKHGWTEARIDARADGPMWT